MSETTMKRWKIVGWYSADPHNEHVRPFARVVYVEAEWHAEASERGSDELDALYAREGLSEAFLNWYASEVKP